MLSPQDIAVIAVIGFVLFGPRKLPELAKSLGQSINEFKKAVKTDENDEAAKRSAEGTLPGPAPQQAIPASTGTPQQLALPAQASDTHRV